MSIHIYGLPANLKYLAVDGRGDAVHDSLLATLQAFLADGWIRPLVGDIRHRADPDMVTCPVCGHVTTEIRGHHLLGTEVCLVCWRTAERLSGQFEYAVQRHRIEFREQITRIVKDVRSGADEPVFYRGFE